MFAPSRANSAGALQCPVKCWPVRQVIAPRPKSPPTPIANFSTDGITITHSALLSRSFGIPSGMSIISLNTWPHAARRFCSLLSFAAKVGQARKTAMTKTLIFLMARLPNICSILAPSALYDNRLGGGLVLSENRMARGDPRGQSHGESRQSYPQSAFQKSLARHIRVVNKLLCRQFPATLLAAPLQLECVMKSTKWMFTCALGILMLTVNYALAQGHRHGKGHGKHEDEGAQGEQFYKDHDREVILGC